jgi:DNA-binding transcriptional ArsR family regulator
VEKYKILNVFQAIGEPTRFRILRMLTKREMSASQIAGKFSSTRPAISQHLRVLRKAGLLSERRVGTFRYYRVRNEAFDELRKFIDSYWEFGLARLKESAENIESDKS